MIEVSWSVVAFIVITLVFIWWFAWEERVNGFEFNAKPIFIIFLWLLVLAIWGGIFWW